jgi:Family of unknown function (DUF6459)
VRQQARPGARRTLPNPAATARALALAICEVEAGLRSASQLERICHPVSGLRSPTASSGPGAQPSVAPVFCGSRPQELTPGLVDAVAVVRRGQRAVFMALRLEAVPGRWELIELLY